MNIEQQLQHIARGITEQIPPDWEFLLMVFPRAAGRQGYHVATLPPDQIIQVLKELIKEIETQGS